MKREEVVGQEGGSPPILLRFWEGDGTEAPLIGDRLVGIYARVSMEMEPIALGPMFGDNTPMIANPS